VPHGGARWHPMLRKYMWNPRWRCEGAVRAREGSGGGVPNGGPRRDNALRESVLLSNVKKSSTRYLP